MKEMTKTDRYFYIKDIDCTVLVEVVSTRKEVFGWLDDYAENLQYDWFDPCGDSFEILYEDGTTDYIADDYDGHKIRRQHIVSMVYSNASSYIVYGNFEMNEYGVVSVSENENIDDTNIKEVDCWNYSEVA